MFIFKAKKHHSGILGNVLMMKGKGVITENMGKGLKMAGSQMEYIGKYMKNNPGISILSSTVQKNPTGSALAVIGLGLAVFGIASLIKR